MTKFRGFIISNIFLLLTLQALCGPDVAMIPGEEPDSGKAKHSKRHSGDDKSLIDVENTAMLIDAKKEVLIGNTDKALQMFTYYTEHYPNDPAGKFELARLLATSEKYNAAYDLLKDAIRLDPNNKYYQIFLAEVCQQCKKEKEAIGIYENLVKKYPGELDYYFQLAALYLNAGDEKKAAETYDQIEGKAGINEEISLQKEKIYLHLGNIEKAENELRSLVSAFPDDSRYLSMLAEFYMGNNQQNKALEIYKRVVEKDPGNPYIHMSLADYYRKTGNKEKAFEELKLGFANPNLDIDTKVTILLSFYTINQIYDQLKEQAFELSRIMITIHPDNPKAWSIYGDLLSQDKKYTEAKDAFLKVISLDSSKYVVWEELLRLELQLTEYQVLYDHGKKALELFPDQNILYLFTGLGAVQLKKYDEAIKILDHGVRLVVNNDDLIAQFYMYIGDAWHSLKNTEESDKAYEKSLKAKDNNAYVLNNFAYYLSLRGKDLERAEKMAKKAVELDTANSSFEDTYGWVLYKLGKISEAKKWIGKALEDKESVSSEVLEHYGDVLYRLGEPEKALEYWNKAKSKGEGSELLNRKISEKKLIEQNGKE
ncbi:MAG: tetratricopeptide repeat protein [Bacteroidetes bacterium]|nr:tetratricopeptide repeat protein [Bacteroidota bacterium]